VARAVRINVCMHIPAAAVLYGRVLHAVTSTILAGVKRHRCG
jgi:hypothetical protein